MLRVVCIRMLRCKSSENLVTGVSVSITAATWAAYSNISRDRQGCHVLLEMVRTGHAPHDARQHRGVVCASASHHGPATDRGHRVGCLAAQNPGAPLRVPERRHTAPPQKETFGCLRSGRTSRI